MRTLHSPRCDMQWVLAILASLLVSQVQCGKFSVISVLPNITNSRMFCMIYFEKFKELPETPEESEYVKMVNFTAQNGCKKLQSINLKGKLALIRDSADCSLDQVVLNFKAAQAYGIVIASSRYKIENLIAEKNDSNRTDIVVGFVTDGTAEHILALMRPKEPLIVKVYPTRSSLYDWSLVIIWGISMFVVAVGSYWSGTVKYEIYRRWASKKQAEKATAEMVAPGPPLADVEGRGPPPTPDDFFEEEVALNISPGIVVVFVCLMGGMLVVLYFFFKYLVYFLIGMFALGAIVSTIVVFEPLIYRLPIGTTRIPQKYIPCFNGPLEIRQLALIVVSAGLAIFWVVIRHQSYSWMLQNFFGMMFGINLLKSLRMPSLMIIFWMLVLLFVYDIFFVFLTPYVTKKPVNETGSLGKTRARGDSIMVEVAKGTDSREMIPMVLRVPRMINKEMEACVSRYALLGYGDIIIPGLLIAYCHGFDLIHTMGRLYYIQGVISYGVGLVITFVALYLMRTAQPALLYLVPATLIPTIVTSYFRGHFRDIWSGAWPMLSESEDTPAPSAEKTSQPEEDEGPRLVHGNERLSQQQHGQGLYGPDARSQMWRPT